jgi:hypothetical protein
MFVSYGIFQQSSPGWNLNRLLLILQNVWNDVNDLFAIRLAVKFKQKMKRLDYFILTTVIIIFKCELMNNCNGLIYQYQNIFGTKKVIDLEYVF